MCRLCLGQCRGVLSIDAVMWSRCGEEEGVVQVQTGYLASGLAVGHPSAGRVVGLLVGVSVFPLVCGHRLIWYCCVGTCLVYVLLYAVVRPDLHHGLLCRVARCFYRLYLLRLMLTNSVSLARLLTR